MPTDPLTTPVTTVASLISAHEYFTGVVEANTELVGDIAQTLKIQLSKLGLAIAVLVPSLGDLTTRGSGFEAELDIVVEVSELVMLNRTGKGAGSAALQVIKAIHKKPNGLDQVGAMHRAGINEINVDLELSAKRQAHPRYLVYHVYATTRVIL